MAEFAVRDAANRAWLAESFAREPDAKAAVISIQADLFFRQICGQGYDSGYRRDPRGRSPAPPRPSAGRCC